MAEKKKKPYEIGELDQYLFGQGNHYEIYKKLGAHLVQDGKQKGVYFAVWAPHAQARSEERRVGKECRSRWSPYH